MATPGRTRGGGEETTRAELAAAIEAAGREHSGAVVMFHTAVAAHLGLNATDSKVLDLLERHGPLTAGRLGELTGLAPASVTGVLDRLEARGHVRRERDPEDRRRVVVELAGGSAQAVEPLFDDFLSDLRRINRRYSADELAVILDWLQRVTVAQREAAARLSGGAAG